MLVIFVTLFTTVASLFRYNSKVNFFKRHAKRIVIDSAGYGLIVLGVLLSPVPGPGGLPLILAGLALLSINNSWAERLRLYVLEHGGKMVKLLFPSTTWVQWLYDVLVVVLLILVGVLAWQHQAVWQISLSVSMFFLAVFVALMNRDRLKSIKHK